jgi:serine/threonine-protein kinase
MGTAMYVSPEQATGAPVDNASDIYSLGVVAYECLAGHPPFTAREPLAIAFAHKHEPVPALPPDVPPPVSDLVYHMLAKTPEERPANVRVVADRADMLRDALALGDSAQPGDYPQPADYAGVTRADLPAAATGVLLGEAGAQAPPGGPGRPRGGRSRAGRSRGGRRRLVTASVTAALCAVAAAVGLYLTGHIAGQASGQVGNNTARHVNSPSAIPSHSASQHPQPTAHPSVVTVHPTPTLSPTVSPQPVKSPTPTPTKKASPTASASASASTSPTATSSPTASTSPTATSSPTH